MHAWSNYYQDLPPVMIPTFDKYFDPAPKIEQQFIYDTIAQVPHLGVHYSAKRFHEMYNEMVSTTSRVDVKLTFEEIMAIRDMVTKSTKTKVSTMDCLAAYFVTVLNRTEDVPIREISNLLQASERALFLSTSAAELISAWLVSRSQISSWWQLHPTAYDVCR
jgi:hypothetical protein